MEKSRPVPDPVAIVLAPAIEAARKAVHQRDSADVPHALRRVAQPSGPKLPPPLFKKLLEGLEEDGDLRSDAREHLDAVDGAAAAFLDRPDGWWRTVAAAVDEVADARNEKELAKAVKRLSSAETESATTKRRLDEARQAVDDLQRELKAARTDNADRIEAHRRGDLERISELEGLLAASRAAEERAIGDAMRLTGEVDQLRKRVARSRKSATQGPGNNRMPGLGGDAQGIARGLDLTYRMLSRRISGQDDDAEPEDAVPQLSPPDGLRPTEPGWFDWIVTVDAPVWLIVDGHNVVFSISEDRSRVGDSVRRLEAALRRVRTRAVAPLRISVIYDSDLGGDRSAPQAIGGLDVRFAPQHSIADDEIVSLATGAADPVVVVTSDRELRDRVSAAALVIDGVALARFATGG
jgi:hypothetical protein